MPSCDLMDAVLKELIDKAKALALAGKSVDRSLLSSFLDLDPLSEESEYLGHAAREIARAVGNQGKVWTAIGVDYRPCSMNCEFCSFGEKWNLMSNTRELTDQEIVEDAINFVNQGASWVTLRTTEFFDLNRLCGIAKTIRENVLGDYGLVVNTGEFDLEMANKFADSGIDIVYHTLRLGEGTATPFKPQERVKTINAVRDSSMKLAYLVEPVGAEHTNDEILDVLDVGLSNHATLCGAMARVNIANTPFQGSQEIDEDRLAQIVAVTRIAGGINVPEICVHPPSQKALQWGANVLVVEKGAIPRSETNCCDAWKGFNIEDAKEMFKTAGYSI